MAKLQVGDTVYTTEKGKIREHEVEKIGRKYIKLKYSRAKFDVGTLSEVDYSGWACQLYLSKQDILDEAEHLKLCNTISRAFDGRRKTDNYSLEQLRAIMEIIGEDVTDKNIRV